MDPDDDEEIEPGNIYRDGKIHVLTEMCSTCIFKPHARPVPGSRVAQMVRDTKDDPGATVPCHKTLYEQDGEKADAICRGWYDRFADSDPLLRMAQGMGVIEFQEPPHKE